MKTFLLFLIFVHLMVGDLSHFLLLQSGILCLVTCVLVVVLLLFVQTLKPTSFLRKYISLPAVLLDPWTGTVSDLFSLQCWISIFQVVGDLIAWDSDAVGTSLTSPF